MGSDERSLFLVYLAAGVALLILFLGRKKEKPTMLDLSSKRGESPSLGSSRPEIVDDAGDSGPQERSINVIFQYNGHSWEAFEVLGIPVGSSKGEAERAFDKLKKNSDPGSIAFYKAALDAIRRN